MRRALPLILAGIVVLSPSAAVAGPSLGDQEPPPATSGTLTSEGLSLAADIAEDGAPPTSNPPPPPEDWYWVVQEWPWPTTPCVDGQIHYYAWRIHIPTGWTIRFYRLLGSGRDPSFAENSPIDPADFDPAYEVWFVHVCYGPPRPDVEASVIDDEQLAPPTIGLNPPAAVSGVTGLETWMWHDYDRGTFGNGPSVSLDLPVTDPSNGITYRITGSAWSVGYEWVVTEDGTEHRYVATDPGTEGEANASAAHLFETKGEWSIAMANTWVGEYTISGYTGTEPLGPVTLADSVVYPVGEVRSVLPSPGER